ncbi:MAG: hypothetical protein AB1403_09135 [Candidatus Riflebacteria bacterium]
MRKPIMLLGFLLFAASCIFAGPVNPSDIDSRAVWYGHIDMESIMNLPLVQEIHKSSMKTQKKNFFNQMCHKLGMQLMGEFLSATMYATQYEGEFGVVVLKFRNDLPKENLHAIFAQKYPQRKESLIGNRSVFTWQMCFGRKHKEISGCFVNDRQILIGADLGHVEKALEVLDQKRPSMPAHHPLMKGLTPGILFVSRAIDVPAAYQFSTFCPVLRHSREAFARWTFLDGTIRGRYEFQVIDREKAELYHQAVEGMKAMFALRFSDFDKVLPLLNGFSIVQAGKSVILSWEGSSDQVKTAVDQIKARRRQIREIRREFNEK